jgi:putative oxidoreductase
MEKYTPLLARILLSTIFIYAGITKILDPMKTQQYMESQGVPGILIVPTIIVLLVGGISILIGYQARWGALLLIGFLIPTTLIFHSDFPGQTTNFLKNLGLMGGLFMIFTFGAGAISFDHKKTMINMSNNN